MKITPISIGCLAFALLIGGYQVYDIVVNKATDLSPFMIIGTGLFLAGAIVSLKFATGADPKGQDSLPTADPAVMLPRQSPSAVTTLPANPAPVQSNMDWEEMQKREMAQQPLAQSQYQSQSKVMTPNLACPNCGTIMEIPQNTFDRLFQTEQGIGERQEAEEEVEPPDFDKYYDEPVLGSNEAMKRKWYASMNEPQPDTQKPQMAPEPDTRKPQMAPESDTQKPQMAPKANPQYVHRDQVAQSPVVSQEPVKKKGLLSMFGLNIKVKPKAPTVDRVDAFKAAELAKKSSIGNLPRYETEQDLVLKRKIADMRR